MQYYALLVEEIIIGNLLVSCVLTSITLNQKE